MILYVISYFLLIILCQSTLTIYNQRNKLYPLQYEKHDICNLQSQYIEFYNNQILTINNDYPFFVTLSTNNSGVLFNGLSKSKPNQDKSQSAQIIITIKCPFSYSASIYFDAYVTISDLRHFVEDNFQKQEKIIKLNAIIFCVPKKDRSIIQNALNIFYLLLWVLIHCAIQVPSIISMSYLLKSIIVVIYILSGYLPDNLAGICQLAIFYSLGLHLVGLEEYRRYPYRNSTRFLHKIIWFLLWMSFGIIFINNLLFDDTHMFYYFHSIISIQISLIVIGMLVYITRLRGLVLMVIFCYFLTYLPQSSVFVLKFPTPFQTNCKVNNLLLTIFLFPIIAYLRTFRYLWKFFTIPLLIISLISFTQSFSSYIPILLLLFLWMTVLAGSNGLLKVICNRRTLQ